MRRLQYTLRFSISILLLWYIPVSLLFAQSKTTVDLFEKWKAYKLKPVLAFQLWSTYTGGQKRFDSQLQTYTDIANRLNFQLRRSRIGLKGQFREGLNFNFTTALDLVGRDPLSATQGGSNNGASPKFRAWNVFMQWQLKPQSEAVHLVFGYFTPQIGRESMTSAFRVSSMEKAWTQNYLRRQLTGTGPGRAVGINLGGVLKTPIDWLNFNYNLGLFNPSFTDDQIIDEGKRSPLVVGRLQMDFGNPELKKYSLVRKTSYFKERKGFSLAIAGAKQSTAAFHNGNYALSVDALFNWGPWNIDGEWAKLGRKSILDISSQSSIFHIRGSYLISLEKEYLLEPVLLIARFQGATSYVEQVTADSLLMDSGEDHYLDIGLNLYFNPNLKLSLHATFQNGKLGAAEKGAIINQFFYQNQIGAIQRGDWLGLGMVAIL